MLQQVLSSQIVVATKLATIWVSSPQNISETLWPIFMSLSLTLTLNVQCCVYHPVAPVQMLTFGLNSAHEVHGCFVHNVTKTIFPKEKLINFFF